MSSSLLRPSSSSECSQPSFRFAFGWSCLLLQPPLVWDGSTWWPILKVGGLNTRPWPWPSFHPLVKLFTVDFFESKCYPIIRREEWHAKETIRTVWNIVFSKFNGHWQLIWCAWPSWGPQKKRIVPMGSVWKCAVPFKWLRWFFGWKMMIYQADPGSCVHPRWPWAWTNKINRLEHWHVYPKIGK